MLRYSDRTRVGRSVSEYGASDTYDGEDLVSRNNHAWHEQKKLECQGRATALAELIRYAAYSFAFEEPRELDLIVTASVELLRAPGLDPRKQLETETAPLEALSVALPPGADKQDVLRRLVHTLQQASSSWQQTDPETPPAEAVANCIISVLHESRLHGLRVDPNLPTRPEDW